MRVHQLTVAQYRRHFESGSDHGVVAVITCVLIVVLVGMAAFVVDHGMAYANRRALSNAADAAAQAGARELQVRYNGGQDCAALLTNNSTNQSAVQTVAVEYAESVGLSGLTTTVESYCDAAGNAVVSATVTMDSPAFFGAVFGRERYALSRTARAIVAPASQVTGVKPLAICYEDADWLLEHGFDSGFSGSQVLGHSRNVDIKKTSGTSCVAEDTTTGSGNWSFLDFKGDSRSSEMQDYIVNGYKGPLNIPGPNTAAYSGSDLSNARDQFDAILNTQALIPVYDSTTTGATGSNTAYRVAGFISAQICGWRTKNSGGAQYVTPGCYDTSNPIPNLPSGNKVGVRLQLRLSRLIPAAEVNFGCGIGQSGCRYSPLIVRPIA